MSNVVVRDPQKDLVDDFREVVGIVRRNVMCGGPEVCLPESDRLVQAGLLVQNVPVSEERIKIAEEMLEQEQLFMEGYGRPDSVQLPQKYERWGFTCAVSRKADLATVFFFGTPVIWVDADEWGWFELDPRTPYNEARMNASDALEQYGEYPCTEDQRDLHQGYNICEFVELIQETWLR